ncbi:MAG: prepilin peptidase [Gammaproteobacteria bacterium]|jgi:leader peptidase (prepilin peptidase)/N-methyltransferase|nr:prepilin peptidase [Gammaproteobacteria bacterium]
MSLQALWFFLQQQPNLAILIVGIFSLLVGSFLNVVIYRLPRAMQAQWQREAHDLLATTEADLAAKPAAISLLWPPSHCPVCQAHIKPWHNIPVLGYLLLRGRCAQCHNPIGLRYPLVEALTGLSGAYMVWQLGITPAALVSLLLLYTLVALAFIDLDHHLLPDQLTLPLLWLGLICNSQGLLVSLPDAMWGAVAGYLCLWSVYWLFRLLTGREGMGYGDFKLLAALGAWLGWQALPLVLLLAALSGLLVALGQKLTRGAAAGVLPFGPYLALGGLLVLWHGEFIWYWYGSLWG